jgi:transitional endoplasmic reticulum ATPase
MARAAFDPDRELATFTYAGCEVTLVDPERVLAAAEEGPVELLRDAAFPPPVRQVVLRVGAEVRDGRPVHAFDARVHVAPALSVLGADPLGVLLARRLASGDPWAGRVVDRMGGAVDRAHRLLNRGRAAAADATRPQRPAVTVVEDAACGLRASVTGDEPAATGAGRVLTVRAVVPSAEVGPPHLRAIVRLVLRLVVQQTGSARSLAGRRYVVSPHRPGDAADVSLDQVGGLAPVVAQFRQVAVSFRHPQVMARWGARRPQGILLYGPPGTGKTMLARALATEIGGRYREIRTTEILDKWLGASERNIKRIFRDARRYREPTVMLFDEFDSIISYAGFGGDAASQAVNAVAGIFKQEMNDLIEANPNVIVVATTNFPDRVDESLIRSGRFDIKIEVPRPDESGRADILRTMLRELRHRHEVPGFRMFADDVDADALAGATAGMTGADLKELLRRVRLDKAMAEARTGAAEPITQADLAAVARLLREDGTGG